MSSLHGIVFPGEAETIIITTNYEVSFLSNQCFVEKGNCCDLNVHKSSSRAKKNKYPQLYVHADLQHNAESLSRENPKIEATDTQKTLLHKCLFMVLFFSDRLSFPLLSFVISYAGQTKEIHSYSPSYILNLQTCKYFLI